MMDVHSDIKLRNYINTPLYKNPIDSTSIFWVWLGTGLLAHFESVILFLQYV